MQRPREITHETAHGTIVLNSLDQLIVKQGKNVINGGTVNVNGQARNLFVAIDDKPELQLRIEAWKAEWAEYENWKAAEFARNVPGYDELRTARRARLENHEKTDRDFDEMIDSGDSTMSQRADESLVKAEARLAERYSRAALYIRAEHQAYAVNFKKANAGRRAMEMIANGAKLAEAKNVLENWLA